MTWQFRDGRWRAPVMVGMALYVLCLIVTPLEHCDLICHVKTPLHCTACASTHVGASPRTPPLPGAWTLADAGRAETSPVSAERRLTSHRSTGRSPPDSHA